MTHASLFSGIGGFDLAAEWMGWNNLFHCEWNPFGQKVLKHHFPNSISYNDITKTDFTIHEGSVDILTGGFPCQPYSTAGKRLGKADERHLFPEMLRCIKEVKPRWVVGENVRGLLNHDGGRTLAGMKSILDEIGYKPLDEKILKAIFYRVPQKRERLILIGVRKDIDIDFAFPKPYKKIYKLKDALQASELFPVDVPKSLGVSYPKRKKEILDKVPPGGYWRDLPLKLQKEYMQKSFFLGGGKTGMARRMSWDEPSLTLTCSPAQKQTERCHPDETRPFTVREYARIQTFPDDWQFAGSVAQQYKQIGNAVPVNLAHELGYSIVRFLNQVYEHYSLESRASLNQVTMSL
jgi:DNA (cytosine-5)-methyltransferase 1